MEKTISALDARRRLGELLEEVYYKGNQFIVERAGKPMAAVVPIKHYRQWRKKRDELFAVIDEVGSATRTRRRKRSRPKWRKPFGKRGKSGEDRLPHEGSPACQPLSAHARIAPQSGSDSGRLAYCMRSIL